MSAKSLHGYASFCLTQLQKHGVSRAFSWRQSRGRGLLGTLPVMSPSLETLIVSIVWGPVLELPRQIYRGLVIGCTKPSAGTWQPCCRPPQIAGFCYLQRRSKRGQVAALALVPSKILIKYKRAGLPKEGPFTSGARLRQLPRGLLMRIWRLW